MDVENKIFKVRTAEKCVHLFYSNCIISFSGEAIIIDSTSEGKFTGRGFAGTFMSM